MADNTTALPDDVRGFILDNIDSVSHIEALLLLRRDPDTSWQPSALAQRLYIAEDEAARVLQELAARSLISGEHHAYRYASASQELTLLVDRLAHFYSTQLIPVTNLIHARATGRVQQFADAFRFRKDE